LFIVDILKEHIAVAESKKLNIPTFAIVDTNSDPKAVDFAIPANDDASKSISLIVDIMTRAVEEGLMERKTDKDRRVKEERLEKEEAEKKKAQAEQERDTEKDVKSEDKEDVKKLKEDDKKEGRDTPRRPRRSPSLKK